MDLVAVVELNMIDTCSLVFNQCFPSIENNYVLDNDKD